MLVSKEVFKVASNKFAYESSSYVAEKFAVKLIADVMANAIIEGKQGETFETSEVAEEVSTQDNNEVKSEQISMEEVVAKTEE